jgi:transcriptional regulator with XRE-family HTH domain
MLLPKLKEYRERKGLTQRELADLSGVSRGTIIRVEAGEDCRPPAARKLAAVFGVEPGELMESPGSR